MILTGPLPERANPVADPVGDIDAPLARGGCGEVRLGADGGREPGRPGQWIEAVERARIGVDRPQDSAGHDWSAGVKRGAAPGRGEGRPRPELERFDALRTRDVDIGIHVRGAAEDLAVLTGLAAATDGRIADRPV